MRLIDDVEHIDITMPMYNLTKYSDNYSDTSGSLWQFKRDKITGNINLTNNNSSSLNQILLIILFQMGQTEKKV